MAINAIEQNAANVLLAKQGGTKVFTILSEFTDGNLGTNSGSLVGTARELGHMNQNIVAGFVEFIVFPDDGAVEIKLNTGDNGTKLSVYADETFSIPAGEADTTKYRFDFTVFGEWYGLTLTNKSTTSADVGSIATLGVYEYE